MKFGEALQDQSVPQWSPYNVDYDELKLLIKRNTTRQSGQAITVPGQTDTGLEKFEHDFYQELCIQHDRVNLFVKSKADEIERRLRDTQKKTINLIARCNIEQRKKLSPRRREKFSKLETKTLDCGEESKNLERFIAAQKTAFRKIIKKYKKWTGSTTLSSRFTDEVLGNPKSFARTEFANLKNQYNVILTLIQQTSPPQSGASTPLTPSRQESRMDLRRQREPSQMPQQSYWNEYDNGSEAGDANEPYTIFIDPQEEATFPGAKAVIYVYTALSSRAKVPIEKVRGWLSPQSTPNERRPLIGREHGGYFSTMPNSPLETDADDDASSSDFPNGYDAHYATFPSIQDQKLARHREKLLFQATFGSFLAAFLLLIISGLLVATGRHRLRVEVDAGVIVGVVASLLFATMGFTTMIYRYSRIGWLQRSSVTVSFLMICVLSGMLLVLVMGNTSL